MEKKNGVATDDTELLAKSEEEVEIMVGHFDDVCRRRILKVNGNIRH